MRVFGRQSVGLRWIAACWHELIETNIHLCSLRKFDRKLGRTVLLRPAGYTSAFTPKPVGSAMRSNDCNEEYIYPKSEPGIQKIAFPRATPARARDITATEPSF